MGMKRIQDKTRNLAGPGVSVWPCDWGKDSQIWLWTCYSPGLTTVINVFICLPSLSLFACLCLLTLFSVTVGFGKHRGQRYARG